MILPVPIVIQTAEYDCGTTAAKAVFRYYNRRLPDLEKVGVPCPIDGTDPRTMESLIRRAGFGVEAGETRISTLRHHTREGRPAIALVQKDGVGHWVVVCGVERGRVHLMDPYVGQASERVNVFEARWRDVCRDGSPYFQWALVVGQ